MSRIIYTPRREQKTRPSRRVLRLALAPAALLALGAAAVAFFRLPPLQIREIKISGLQSFETRVVEERVASHLDGAYFAFLPRRSYFLADAEGLASALRREFPQMEQILAVKRFPNALHVAVIERSLWGIFCNAAEKAPPYCVYIDPTGFAYDEAPQVEGALILGVERDGEPPAVGDIAVERATMDRLRLLKDALAKLDDLAVTGFGLKTRVPGEIRVKTGEGFVLIFSRDDDFARTADVLKRVLNEEIKEKRGRLEYVDLRFGNKVFYKLK